MKGFVQIILVILVAIIAIALLYAVAKFFFGGGGSGSNGIYQPNSNELILVVRDSKYYLADKEVPIDSAVDAAKKSHQINPNLVVYIQDEKARIEAWDKLEAQLRSVGISPQPRRIKN